MGGTLARAMPTIESEFNAHRNSLNALRLALAAAVIVSHSWPAGGYGDDPGFGDQNLGAWAVAGFFAISGYLITMSRVHSPTLLDYMWRRFLRIYPAFLVSLLAVAFIFAPVSVYLLHSGTYSLHGASRFVLENIALYTPQPGIPGTLENAPFPIKWNSPLWTLFFEFLCYIGIGILVSILPRRFVTLGISVVFVGCTLITAVHMYSDVTVQFHLIRLARLGAFFAAGALMFAFRGRIPLTRQLAAAAALLLLAVMAAGTFQLLAGIPAAYLVMALGTWLPLQNIGAKNDISYGMYIYSFPLQQLLNIAFPNQVLPVWVFVLLSVALTVPFAWGSWKLIEQPAMKFKRLFKPKTPVLKAVA